MCDIGSAISAGISLLTSDDGGSGAYYQAAGDASATAGQAALRGVALQEEQFAMEKPYRQKLISAGISGISRAEELATKELPLQLRVVDEAMSAGSEDMQEAAAGRAATDARMAIDANNAGRERRLASLGLAKPGDPAYTAGSRVADAANAATLAQATTNAREGERKYGIEQRIRVGGQARGYNPNVSVNNNPGGSMMSAASGLSSVASGQASLGNAAYNQSMTESSNIGKAVGSIADRVFKSAGTTPPINPNPIISDSWIDFEEGGEVPPPEALSGPIEGPSHAAGGVPIEAEGGEYIIRKDTVAKYGPRLLSAVNDGSAIIIPTAAPRRIGAGA